MRLLYTGLLLAALLGFQPDAWAQDPTILPRLSGSIQLDGLSNEPAWEALAPLPATMYQPVFQGEMTERTEFRIAYDDNYLYVAGRFYDTDPGVSYPVHSTETGARLPMTT